MSQEVNIPAQPETVVYRPFGSGVQREDGEVRLQFLLPDKVVVIAIPDEGEQLLLSQLSGITIASALPPVGLL